MRYRATMRYSVQMAVTAPVSKISCHAAIGLVHNLGGRRVLSIHEQQLQCLHDFGTIE